MSNKEEYLIRIKDGTTGITSGLSLPKADEFDVPFSLNLTRKKTNEVKQLLKDKNHYKAVASSQRFDYLPVKSKKHDPAVFYQLSFRIVHFPISDTSFETIITNLDADLFPLPEIKKLYALRWGIETSFRHLKHTLALLHLHAKKVEFVCKSVFSADTHNYRQNQTGWTVLDKIFHTMAFILKETFNVRT